MLHPINTHNTHTHIYIYIYICGTTTTRIKSCVYYWRVMNVVSSKRSVSLKLTVVVPIIVAVSVVHRHPMVWVEIGKDCVFNWWFWYDEVINIDLLSRSTFKCYLYLQPLHNVTSRLSTTCQSRSCRIRHSMELSLRNRNDSWTALYVVTLSLWTSCSDNDKNSDHATIRDAIAIYNWQKWLNHIWNLESSTLLVATFRICYEFTVNYSSMIWWIFLIST